MACVALPTCGLALAESERYLPELIGCARRAARGARPLHRRHRHPHDRLPERLRAALSRGNRPRRQRPRAATTSISARHSTARGCPSSTPKTSITPESSPRLIRCSRPMRPSASRTSISANSPSARASSLEPATAAISMPTPARNGRRERAPAPPARRIRPPRIDTLARLPVFFALAASARSSPAAMPPPRGKSNCFPPRARMSMSIPPSLAMSCWRSSTIRRAAQ